MGNRRDNLARAIRLLSGSLTIEQVSSIYETEPTGYIEQPLFYNAVCKIVTDLSPTRLLALIKNIEGIMGRQSSFPNAPRNIDIDILLYDNLIIETKNLTIPHPRLAERAFVLVPMAEIAPLLKHPESGKTIRELVESAEGLAGIQKIE